MAIAHIHVTLKPTLFDAQGATVTKALHQLGHNAVREARIGKYITLDIDDALAGPELQQRLDLMCHQLLANPVIEDFTITLGDVRPAIANAIPAAAPAPVPAPPPAPTSRVAASNPSPGELKTLGGQPISEPFALDYRTYRSLTTEERLSLRGVALQKHGTWILQQLQERRAHWILCIGGEVMDAGPSLDTYPSEERLVQLGESNDLVPWVFTLPPRAS
jgi:phosphoribosylformylglycinamidine synthase